MGRALRMSPVSHGLQESGKGRAHTARMWEAAWLKRIRMGVCGCGAWRCRAAPVGPDAPVVGIDSVGIDVVGTDSVGWDMDDAGMGDVGITDDGTTGDGSVGMTSLYDSYCGSP